MISARSPTHDATTTGCEARRAYATISSRDARRCWFAAAVLPGSKSGAFFDCQRLRRIIDHSESRASSNWKGSMRDPVHLTMRPGRPVLERAPKKSEALGPQPLPAEEASPVLLSLRRTKSRGRAERRRRRRDEMPDTKSPPCARRPIFIPVSRLLPGRACGRRRATNNAVHGSSVHAPVPGSPAADVAVLSEELGAQVAPGGGLVGEEDDAALWRRASRGGRGTRRGVMRSCSGPACAP